MSTSAIGSRPEPCWRILPRPNSTTRLRKPRRRWPRTRRHCSRPQASRDLADVTNGRDSKLVKQGWLTLQQGDNDRLTLKAQQAAVGVAQSNIAAQEAQIRVLEQEKAYQRVVAPFDGVITQRNIDNGSLVTVRIDLHVHADAPGRDPHPGVRPAGRGFRAWARRRCGGPCPGDSGSQLSRQGHAHRERVAAGQPDTADRNRRSQSGRRAQSRNLLHRRTVYSAQDAIDDHTGRRGRIRSERPARRGGREWHRPFAEDHDRA